MASTQPTITSSTAAGSTSTRSNRPWNTPAPKSIGCTPARDPLRLPAAVRTASTMYASGISDSFFGYSAKDDGEVLPTHLLGGERPAGLIPAHRYPGGVTDEAVDKIDVQIRPEVALFDALIEHLDPHLALLFVQVVDIGEPRLRRQPLGFVLVDDDLRMPILDRLERRHEQSLEPLQGIWFAVDDLAVTGEEPVEEPAHQVVDHLFFGGEVVVQAAGQDAGAVGDIAHGGGAQAALGEHLRSELQQLVSAA